MDDEMHSVSVTNWFSTEEGKSGADKKHMPKTLTEQLEDFFSLEVWRASVPELIGTAVLVFALETIVISPFETDTKTPNLFYICFCFCLIFLLFISCLRPHTACVLLIIFSLKDKKKIFIVISVSILILATFPISGGNLNSAIIFSAALLGVISFARATIFILAQCLGAVLGALALQAVVSDLIVGIGTSQAFWLEIFCMFVVLFASLWIAFDGRQAKALVPVVVSSTIGLVVGLMVFVSTTLTGTAKSGYAGAGMNPARCLGPALVRGGHLWDGHWIFWLGPSIACLAFYMYIQIIPRQHFQPSKQGNDEVAADCVRRHWYSSAALFGRT
ncbi:hypothetical protein MKX01_033087 [Papaver californicum]|nr:hypothetical protein MKX01_033087 [Papaver californicum]